MASNEQKLQFVHFWNFEVQSAFSMRDADGFSTIYGLRIYEWCIRIDRGDTFGFRGIENRGVEVKQLAFEFVLKFIRAKRTGHVAT
ncbi:hypothetical protein KIN20_028340 [Parelaphostrongylus tenuis]|uniref:Uncharacterized protein n=1 Tax=Parelaphostrongylus tenuis TaxID=148309 RepID=A0AAD5WEQ2_PARTN|nr:hypothetical protein KIN20_028340 [Parelaphostrongylus tenuis]